MSLKQKIDEDIKTALRQKDELLLLVLRGVNSAIHNKEIDKKEELTDEEVVEVLMNEAKQRKEAIEEFRKGERDDLAEKEQKELEILKKYLPEQMSEEQIKEIGKKVIEEVGATGLQDTGKIMGALMPKLKGKAEGGIVSKIVSELLRNE